MYYLLALLLLIVLFAAVLHFLGSVLKGCVVVIFVIILGSIIFLFVKSNNSTVDIPFFNYQITDFTVRKSNN